ncbi:MAG: sulfite exporter TauE/SafE family protein, partial [Gammaproteobacteria bacterium]|nr:sulfite exporter TauE/SafE family protein [Gammaproteobacteria bacterium]
VLGTNTIAIRPLWTMFHAAAFLLGLALIWQARQPAWIDSLGQSLWRKARPVLTRLGPRAPIVLGIGWAFMPCGLLYSALLVASLSANVFEGAAIMALFSLGTSISLTAAPWLLLRLRGGQSGAWAIRLAGLALALTSGWALWMGLTNPTGLFCL